MLGNQLTLQESLKYLDANFAVLYSVSVPLNCSIHGDDTSRLCRRNYVDSTYLPSNASFDFVSVDGRARVACMSRALHILKPVGGVLLMDNSDREYYKAGYDLVPSHWLKFEDTVNTGERSTLWVSCLKGQCGRTDTPLAST